MRKLIDLLDMELQEAVGMSFDAYEVDSTPD